MLPAGHCPGRIGCVKPLERPGNHHLKADDGWLKRAMTIDKRSVQRAAMGDPDLKPFRDSLGDTLPQVTD